MRLGIDFGTTHTVVALVDRGNYPIVSYEQGDAIPSIVSVDPSGALRFGAADPGWPALRSFKRLLDAARPDTALELGGKSYLLTELLMQFLAHVRDEIMHRSNAGGRKGEPIEAAVSVPANASTAQRLMTMDAYPRAGFEAKPVLTEPTPAPFHSAHRCPAGTLTRRARGWSGGRWRRWSGGCAPRGAATTGWRGASSPVSTWWAAPRRFRRSTGGCASGSGRTACGARRIRSGPARSGSPSTSMRPPGIRWPSG